MVGWALSLYMRMYLLVWLTLTVWRALQPIAFERWAQQRTLNRSAGDKGVSCY